MGVPLAAAGTCRIKEEKRACLNIYETPRASSKGLGGCLCARLGQSGLWTMGVPMAELMDLRFQSVPGRPDGGIRDGTKLSTR